MKKKDNQQRSERKAVSDVKTRELTKQEIAKIEAETKVIEADLVAKLAEKDKTAAEIAKLAAETRTASAEADEAEISRDRMKRQEEIELVQDHLFRTYVFDDQVSAGTVKKCIKQFTTWDRIAPNCAVRLEINSPGGDIIEGFALIDFLENFKTRHQVTTVAYGMAASMAGVILQAGTTRVMGKNALLLLHEGSMGAVGSFGEVEDRVKLMKTLQERILEIFAEKAIPNNPKTTVAYLRKLWERKDVWLTSEKCLELGLVDEVQ